MSPEDLRHLTEARIAIETQVLRQSIASGPVEWESEVVAAHHTLSRMEMLTADGVVSDEWRAVHADFHRALLAGCPNVRLRAIADSMREVAEVYRGWSAGPGLAAERDVAAEHKALAEAATARDADAASDLLARHIQLTTDLLLDSVTENVN